MPFMVITSVVRANTDTPKLKLSIYSIRITETESAITFHTDIPVMWDVRFTATENPIHSEIRQNSPKENWGKGIIGYSMKGTKINKRIAWILREYVSLIG
ncbi:hypothetical protein HN011_006242 [Eciton burchellii]|nr:hypothetical protein HN011_006242 [Eciton burchellii]